MPPLAFVRCTTRSVLMRMSAPSMAPTPVTSSRTPTVIGVPVGGATAAAGAVVAAAPAPAGLGEAATLGEALADAAATGDAAPAAGFAAAAGLAVGAAAAAGAEVAAGGAADGLEQADSTTATVAAHVTSSYRERAKRIIRSY